MRTGTFRFRDMDHGHVSVPGYVCTHTYVYIDPRTEYLNVEVELTTGYVFVIYGSRHEV